MPELPEASFPVAWDNIKSAYETGWADEWRTAAAEPQPAAAPPPSAPELPRPDDVVIFYLTRRYLPLDDRTVTFADALVNEPGLRQSRASWSTEPFLAFLQAVREATLAERLNNSFHCACMPQIPTEPERLINQLAALSTRHVPVAAAVDPALWLGSDPADAGARAVLDRILDSEQWGGPVLLPMLDAADRALDIPELIAGRRVPTPLCPCRRRAVP
jgi:hypothetical protein